MSDQEIRELGEQVNRDELLELLRIEKGKAADIMIECIRSEKNERLEHNQNTVETLLSGLETDYYGRYEYNDLMNMILEDRRIRMVKWVSMIVEKPVSRFSNSKLYNRCISVEDRNNPSSINFTLKRTLPLAMTIQPLQPSYTPINPSHNITNYNKLMQNQINLIQNKRSHKYSHIVVNVDQINSNYHQHINLLRNYHEGRHAHWNNYVTLKG